MASATWKELDERRDIWGSFGSREAWEEAYAREHGGLYPGQGKESYEEALRNLLWSQDYWPREHGNQPITEEVWKAHYYRPEDFGDIPGGNYTRRAAEILAEYNKLAPVMWEDTASTSTSTGGGTSKKTTTRKATGSSPYNFGEAGWTQPTAPATTTPSAPTANAANPWAAALRPSSALPPPDPEMAALSQMTGNPPMATTPAASAATAMTRTQQTANRLRPAPANTPGFTDPLMASSGATDFMAQQAATARRYEQDAANYLATQQRQTPPATRTAPQTYTPGTVPGAASGGGSRTMGTQTRTPAPTSYYGGGGGGEGYRGYGGGTSTYVPSTGGGSSGGGSRAVMGRMNVPTARQNVPQPEPSSSPLLRPYERVRGQQEQAVIDEMMRASAARAQAERDREAARQQAARYDPTAIVRQQRERAQREAQARAAAERRRAEEERERQRQQQAAWRRMQERDAYYQEQAPAVTIETPGATVQVETPTIGRYSAFDQQPRITSSYQAPTLTTRTGTAAPFFGESEWDAGPRWRRGIYGPTPTTQEPPATWQLPGAPMQLIERPSPFETPRIQSTMESEKTLKYPAPLLPAPRRAGPLAVTPMEQEEINRMGRSPRASVDRFTGDVTFYDPTTGKPVDPFPGLTDALAPIKDILAGAYEKAFPEDVREFNRLMTQGVTGLPDVLGSATMEGFNVIWEAGKQSLLPGVAGTMPGGYMQRMIDAGVQFDPTNPHDWWALAQFNRASPYWASHPAEAAQAWPQYQAATTQAEYDELTTRYFDPASDIFFGLFFDWANFPVFSRVVSATPLGRILPEGEAPKAERTVREFQQSLAQAPQRMESAGVPSWRDVLAKDQYLTSQSRAVMVKTAADQTFFYGINAANTPQEAIEILNAIARQDAARLGQLAERTGSNVPYFEAAKVVRGGTGRAPIVVGRDIVGAAVQRADVAKLPKAWRTELAARLSEAAAQVVQEVVPVLNWRTEPNLLMKVPRFYADTARGMTSIISNLNLFPRTGYQVINTIGDTSFRLADMGWGRTRNAQARLDFLRKFGLGVAEFTEVADAMRQIGPISRGVNWAFDRQPFRFFRNANRAAEESRRLVALDTATQIAVGAAKKETGLLGRLWQDDPFVQAHPELAEVLRAATDMSDTSREAQTFLEAWAAGQAHPYDWFSLIPPDVKQHFTQTGGDLAGIRQQFNRGAATARNSDEAIQLVADLFEGYLLDDYERLMRHAPTGEVPQWHPVNEMHADTEAAELMHDMGRQAGIGETQMQMAQRQMPQTIQQTNQAVNEGLAELSKLADGGLNSEASWVLAEAYSEIIKAKKTYRDQTSAFRAAILEQLEAGNRAAAAELWNRYFPYSAEWAAQMVDEINAILAEASDILPRVVGGETLANLADTSRFVTRQEHVSRLFAEAVDGEPVNYEAIRNYTPTRVGENPQAFDEMVRSQWALTDRAQAAMFQVAAQKGGVGHFQKAADATIAAQNMWDFTFRALDDLRKRREEALLNNAGNADAIWEKWRQDKHRIVSRAWEWERYGYDQARKDMLGGGGAARVPVEDTRPVEPSGPQAQPVTPTPRGPTPTEPGARPVEPTPGAATPQATPARPTPVVPAAPARETVTALTREQKIEAILQRQVDRGTIAPSGVAARRASMQGWPDNALNELYDAAGAADEQEVMARIASGQQASAAPPPARETAATATPPAAPPLADLTQRMTAYPKIDDVYASFSNLRDRSDWQEFIDRITTGPYNQLSRAKVPLTPEIIDDFLKNDKAFHNKEFRAFATQHLYEALTSAQRAAPTSAMNSVRDVLQKAQRRYRIGTEYLQDPDPIAQGLLRYDLSGVEAMVARHATQPPRFMAAGAATAVLDIGDGKVLRIGPYEQVQLPNIPEVLQPIERYTVRTPEGNDLMADIMPRVRTGDVTEAEVQELTRRLREQGYSWSDAATDNAGRLPDGRVVVIDPGSMRPVGSREAPAAPPPAAATPATPATPREPVIVYHVTTDDNANSLVRSGRVDFSKSGTQIDKPSGSIWSNQRPGYYGVGFYTSPELDTVRTLGSKGRDSIIEVEIDPTRLADSGVYASTDKLYPYFERKAQELARAGRSVDASGNAITPELLMDEALSSANSRIDAIVDAARQDGIGALRWSGIAGPEIVVYDQSAIQSIRRYASSPAPAAPATPTRAAAAERPVVPSAGVVDRGPQQYDAIIQRADAAAAKVEQVTAQRRQAGKKVRGRILEDSERRDLHMGIRADAAKKHGVGSVLEDNPNPYERLSGERILDRFMPETKRAGLGQLSDSESAELYGRVHGAAARGEAGAAPVRAAGGAAETVRPAPEAAQAAVTGETPTIRSITDVFKEKNAPKEQWVDQWGNERYSYTREAYTPEYMMKSSETGRNVRYAVTLSDGRVVSLDGAIRITKPDLWQQMQRGGVIRDRKKYAATVWKALTQQEKNTIINGVPWDELLPRNVTDPGKAADAVLNQLRRDGHFLADVPNADGLLLDHVTDAMFERIAGVSHRNADVETYVRTWQQIFPSTDAEKWRLQFFYGVKNGSITPPAFAQAGVTETAGAERISYLQGRIDKLQSDVDAITETLQYMPDDRTVFRFWDYKANEPRRVRSRATGEMVTWDKALADEVATEAGYKDGEALISAIRQKVDLRRELDDAKRKLAIVEEEYRAATTPAAAPAEVAPRAAEHPRLEEPAATVTPTAERAAPPPASGAAGGTPPTAPERATTGRTQEIELLTWRQNDLRANIDDLERRILRSEDEAEKAQAAAGISQLRNRIAELQKRIDDLSASRDLRTASGQPIHKNPGSIISDEDYLRAHDDSLNAPREERVAIFDRINREQAAASHRYQGNESAKQFIDRKIAEGYNRLERRVSRYYLVDDAGGREVALKTRAEYDYAKDAVAAKGGTVAGATGFGTGVTPPGPGTYAPDISGGSGRIDWDEIARRYERQGGGLYDNPFERARPEPEAPLPEILAQEHKRIFDAAYPQLIAAIRENWDAIHAGGQRIADIDAFRQFLDTRYLPAYRNAEFIIPQLAKRIQNFTMGSPEVQYVWDAILQGIFPYTYWATRQGVNTARRVVRRPQFLRILQEHDEQEAEQRAEVGGYRRLAERTIIKDRGGTAHSFDIIGSVVPGWILRLIRGPGEPPIQREGEDTDTDSQWFSNFYRTSREMGNPFFWIQAGLYAAGLTDEEPNLKWSLLPGFVPFIRNLTTLAGEKGLFGIPRGGIDIPFTEMDKFNVYYFDIAADNMITGGVVDQEQARIVDMMLREVWMGQRDLQDAIAAYEPFGKVWAEYTKTQTVPSVAGYVTGVWDKMVTDLEQKRKAARRMRESIMGKSPFELAAEEDGLSFYDLSPDDQEVYRGDDALREEQRLYWDEWYKKMPTAVSVAPDFDMTPDAALLDMAYQTFRNTFYDLIPPGDAGKPASEHPLVKDAWTKHDDGTATAEDYQLATGFMYWWDATQREQGQPPETPILAPEAEQPARVMVTDKDTSQNDFWDRYWPAKDANLVIDGYKVSKHPDIAPLLPRETRDQITPQQWAAAAALIAEATGEDYTPPNLTPRGMPTGTPEEYEDYRQRNSAMFDRLDTKYPGWQDLEDQYYALPVGDARKAFLTENPTLKQAWDDKAAIIAADPILKKYRNIEVVAGGIEAPAETTTPATTTGGTTSRTSTGGGTSTRTSYTRSGSSGYEGGYRPTNRTPTARDYDQRDAIDAQVNARFPGWAAMRQQYLALPEGGDERRQFRYEHPEYEMAYDFRVDLLEAAGLADIFGTWVLNEDTGKYELFRYGMSSRSIYGGMTRTAAGEGRFRVPMYQNLRGSEWGPGRAAADDGGYFRGVTRTRSEPPQAVMWGSGGYNPWRLREWWS